MPYTMIWVRVFSWLSWDDFVQGYYSLEWREENCTQRAYIGVRLCLTFA